MNAEELAALVRQRIESRYRRLVFVHKELNRLNVLAKQESLSLPQFPPLASYFSENPLPGRSFEDFVFSCIDFSFYKKIDAEEFTLLFDKGLDDYGDAFYQKAFSMSREEVQKTISESYESYIKEGSFYLCKKSSPLLLSIMRTLHTSLDFAPLLGGGDEGQIKAAAEVLDGLAIRHGDGMETKLFMPKAGEKIPGIQGRPLLCGTFYPLGKACTIALL